MIKNKFSFLTLFITTTKHAASETVSTLLFSYFHRFNSFFIAAVFSFYYFQSQNVQIQDKWCFKFYIQMEILHLFSSQDEKTFVWFETKLLTHATTHRHINCRDRSSIGSSISFIYRCRSNLVSESDRAERTDRSVFWNGDLGLR